MSLKQIKEFWEYLSSVVKVRGKGDVKYFEDWIKQDYTVDYLIEKKFLKPECKQHPDLDLILLRYHSFLEVL